MSRSSRTIPRHGYDTAEAQVRGRQDSQQVGGVLLEGNNVSSGSTVADISVRTSRQAYNVSNEMAARNYLPLHQGEVIEHRWSMLAESFVNPVGTREFRNRQTTVSLQVMATGIAKSDAIVVDRTGVQLVLISQLHWE